MRRLDGGRVDATNGMEYITQMEYLVLSSSLVSAERMVVSESDENDRTKYCNKIKSGTSYRYSIPTKCD